jgi:dTDP-4-dehydrorhamnose 3,5-epimerase
MIDEIYIQDKYFENRGSIYTIYDSRHFDIKFVQDKISKSNQGVVRGFHGDEITWKLITCLYGKIKLVTYDIDQDIKNTYILDGDDSELVSVLVPPRTLNAHQCLSSHCIFHYKWSEFYTDPSQQWSVKYDDSDISPDWDSSFCDIISDRDRNSGSLKDLKKRVLC